MENPLNKQTKTTPKDFFLWAGVIVALYLSVISLVVLLFEYINILFPNPIEYYVDPYRGAIRSAMATLIVSFPLYVYLVRVINVDTRKHPSKRELKVRKWLIYLSLFGAALTLVIDLIVLINSFLGGDLTTQFLLKVMAILVVIGGVFIYYVKDLKGYWQINEAQSKMVGAIVSAVIIASIIAGFFIMGSPSTQRLLRLDQERVDNLSSIQWQIVNHWQAKGELPSELQDIEESIGGYRVPTDPETNESYTYQVLAPTEFELCATFSLESPEALNDTSFRPKYGFESGNWEHEAGEVCFEREIDEDLYPVREGQRI